jgi:hypothetical protein
MRILLEPLVELLDRISLLSWAKGSLSLTKTSTNIIYCIISRKFINKITLLTLKSFCTRWDVKPNRVQLITMAEISAKWTAVSTWFRPKWSHYLAKWNYTPDCLKIQTETLRLIKLKKSKLASPITFHGWKCRSTLFEIHFQSASRKQMASISSSLRNSRHLVDNPF